jgi:hypothetical protein
MNATSELVKPALVLQYNEISSFIHVLFHSHCFSVWRLICICILEVHFQLMKSEFPDDITAVLKLPLCLLSN